MKTALRLLAALALTAASCSSKDDPAPSTAPKAPAPVSVVGEWKLTTVAGYGTTSQGQRYGEENRSYANQNYRLTFAAGGTFFLSNNNVPGESGTYTYAAGTLTQTWSNTRMTDTFAVPELTANKLVTVEQRQQAAGLYTTTRTYTR